MATNKNKPKNKKSNVARSAKKQSFKFQWWMAAIGVGVVALVGIAVLRFSHAATVTTNMGNTSQAWGGNVVYGANFAVNACRNQALGNRSVLLATATQTTAGKLNWDNGDTLNFGIDEQSIKGASNSFMTLANHEVDSSNYNGSSITVSSLDNYSGGKDKLVNNTAVKSYTDYAHTSFYLQEVHGGKPQAGTASAPTFGTKYRMPSYSIDGAPVGKVFEDNIAYCSYGFSSPDSLYFANVSGTNYLWVNNTGKGALVTAINSDNGNNVTGSVAQPDSALFPNYTTSVSGNKSWSVDTANNKVNYTNTKNNNIASTSVIISPTSVAVIPATNSAWVTSNQSNAIYKVTVSGSTITVDQTIKMTKPNDVIYSTITVPVNGTTPASTTNYIVVSSGDKLGNSFVTMFDPLTGTNLSQTVLPPKDTLQRYTYNPLLSKPTAMVSTGRYIWVLNSNSLSDQPSGSTSLVLIDPTNGNQLQALRQ